MLLYFVQNVFFKSKIILLCVIIAIQHTSSSETSARKTQLAKQDQGRKRPLRKTRCRKFPVKLVLTVHFCCDFNMRFCSALECTLGSCACDRGIYARLENRFILFWLRTFSNHVNLGRVTK